MARGPMLNRANIIKLMENYIDSHIETVGECICVKIYTRDIPHWNEDLFLNELKPKYLEAGWNTVDVSYPNSYDNYSDYIHLGA